MSTALAPRIQEAVVVPDQVAAWAAGVAPTGEVIHLLSLLDPERLSHDGRVDLVVALGRAKAWLEARELAALAAIDAEPPEVADRVSDPSKRWREEELACALRVSRTTAGFKLAYATSLTRLPTTLGLLEAGELTGFHARLLYDATSALSDEQAAAVEARVIAKAPGQDYGSFRRALKRAMTAIAPVDPAEPVRADRRVGFRALGNGMTSQYAILPAEDAAALQTVLDAIAHHRAPGDQRSIDQRRADALTQLALDRLTGADGHDLPEQHGRKPSINVTVAVSTLLGFDDEPAELAGHGPIPAQLGRRLADDPTGSWRRLLTDDHGQLISLSDPLPAPSYRPNQGLTDLVIARDQHCRFPGCHVTAARCEIDHVIPHGRGGPTTRTNLHCLCRRHHRLKHQAGWRVDGNPDATTTWTDPTGRTYHSRPPALG